MQDVVTRVKRTFGDEAGVQISDADIIRWINDAQQEIALNNEQLMQATASASAVQNQMDYDVPADFSILKFLKYKGYRLKHMSFQEFNEYIDGYSEESTYGPGIPEIFMVWEGLITVFPKPQENLTDAFKIYYIKTPAPISTLADDLSLPLVYHNPIVNFCLKQAYELDEDYQKASIKQQEFSDTTMKLNDREKVQDYYPRITTLPEDENYGDWGGYC